MRGCSPGPPSPAIRSCGGSPGSSATTAMPHAMRRADGRLPVDRRLGVRPALTRGEQAFVRGEAGHQLNGLVALDCLLEPAAGHALIERAHIGVDRPRSVGVALQGSAQAIRGRPRHQPRGLGNSVNDFPGVILTAEPALYAARRTKSFEDFRLDFKASHDREVALLAAKYQMCHGAAAFPRPDPAPVLRVLTVFVD